jgi:tRNA1(Val) A37 N6-methylase TrmN6
MTWTNMDEKLTAMPQLLESVDAVRSEVAKVTSRAKKSALGQFMTPKSVAAFMAGLFPMPQVKACHLLDAGAGVGSLTSAFLDRWASNFDAIQVTAHEMDDTLRAHLVENLDQYTKRLRLTHDVQDGDFIEHAVNLIQFGRQPGFTHAILNPPYKKINSASKYRLLLRQVDIETVNLYTAFVALAVAMMDKDGQVVAIIPRSFCNGPYYRPFRDFIFSRAAIAHLHLFESRNTAFKDDQVLQENIIIRLACGQPQGMVTVSTSTDDTFSDLTTHEHLFDRIVFPNDPERFIHVPTSPELTACEASLSLQCSLEDIGVKVSTGPVVDFRLKDHLRAMPDKDTVPLLYPGHFTGGATHWPISDAKKPNAIALNDETKRWLYPTGFYCIVRRFSSKEERRRIVASVIDPADFSGAELLGLENHLNVFHEGRQGMPKALAHGLALFLNSTAVDKHFRRFSGHTQVNATDLKLMKYPSRKTLMNLGAWAMRHGPLNQESIDTQLSAVTA